MKTIGRDSLKKLIKKKLLNVEVSEKDAACIADVLVFADLRGTHSHGVLRLKHYIERVRRGGINLQAQSSIQTLKPTISLLDAQGGFGHVAMHRGSEHAIALAKDQGLGLLGIKNNGHCGTLAYYIKQALDQKLAAMICVNTDKIVIPYAGKRAFLGSNPFAFGFPGEKQSILLDMATSEAAFGKILYAREKEIPIPSTWALDSEGQRTQDPEKARGLLPFGGAKGYGINIMVEALTGLLIGGIFGPHLNSMYGELDSHRNLSSFILVINPAVFGSGEQYLQHTQQMIDEIHAEPAESPDKRIMLPGEIEEQEMRRSLREGISISDEIDHFLRAKPS